MAISSEVLDTLTQEHTRLLREARKLTAEADEIAALLRRNGRLADDEAVAPVNTARIITASSFGSGPAPQGLRQAILAIIEAADRGYRPSEMTNALEARSFQEVGEPATPLSTRVGNELSRLARERQITKDNLGRYVSHRKAARLAQLPLDESAGALNGRG